MLDPIKRAEELYFNNTKTAVENMHCIPYFKHISKTANDISTRFVFDRYKYIETDKILSDTAISIDVSDEIIYYREIRRKLLGVVRHLSLVEAIANRWIEPIMIFINNKFVKWTDIFIYDDRRNTHLAIEPKDILEANEKITKIDVLHLPFTMYYNEENIVEDDKQLIFIFNHKGYFDYGGLIRIYIDPLDSIEYIEGTSALGEVWKYDLDFPDDERIYPNNVLVFKNGLLYREAEVSIDNYNAITIDNGEQYSSDTITYKIFKQPGITKEFRNLDQLANHDYLKHLEYNDEMIAMFKVLNKEFDYEFNPDLTYEDNITQFLGYACRYNYRVIVDEIKPPNTYQIIYHIPDLLNIMDDDGYVTLPYPKKFHTSCFPVVFINGLFSNSLVRKYGKNNFEMRISSVDGLSDTMEVVFFLSYWDRPVLPFSYTEPNKEEYFFMEVKKIQILCKWHPDKCFEMDDEDRCYYTVDKSKYVFKNNALKFLDDTYAGKELIIVPTNRVIYERFNLTANNYRVVLSDRFDYSNDEIHYMVFINGRKLNSSLYRVVLPSPVRPFNNRSIYFHRMLKAGDCVEILYSPLATIDETYIKDLDHSTESGTGIDELGYITGPDDFPVPLSKNLQFYFINGKKVFYKYLHDLSYNIIRCVKDYNSIEDLCIMNFEPDISKEIEKLTLSNSFLDEVYTYMPKSKINIITNTYAYIHNTELAEKADFDKESLIHQIIRDYYVHVNKGVPFRYTYDKDTFTEVDSAGNILLDVIDGTVYKNINAEEVHND